jgi:hypothetical protein
VTSKVAKSKNGRPNPVAFNFKIKSRKVFGNPSRSDLFKLKCQIGQSTTNTKECNTSLAIAKNRKTGQKIKSGL